MDKYVELRRQGKDSQFDNVPTTSTFQNGVLLVCKQ